MTEDLASISFLYFDLQKFGSVIVCLVIDQVAILQYGFSNMDAPQTSELGAFFLQH